MQKFPDNGSLVFPDILNFYFQAWDLWNERKALEMVDLELGKSYPTHDVLKFIQIGLLCVQESPADRPKMSTIVFMVDYEIVLLSPSKPAFTIRRK
jgi:hypothetical protein